MNFKFWNIFSKKHKALKKQNILETIKNQDTPLTNKQLKAIKKANDWPLIKQGEIDTKNSPNCIIDFKNVSKYYIFGSVVTKVFTDINFHVKEGDFAILSGKSGSGKSTILNLMSGLDRASEGQIIVDGNNLSYLKNWELTKFRRENISFIFQSYNLLNNINSYDNVEVGAYLQKDKSKILNIDELFKEFELEEVKFKFPSQMSGGQQQRISILRALIKNAKIIFADEPTGALDETNTNIVLKILKEINKKYKTTIIMVSHDDDMKPLANLLIQVEKGTVKTIRQEAMTFEEFIAKKEKEQLSIQQNINPKMEELKVTELPHIEEKIL